MMSSIKWNILLITGMAFLSVNASAQACSSLSELSGFVGNWQHQDQESKVTENWQQVSASSFEGSATFYDESSKEQSKESLRLVEMSGAIFYIAKVSANNLPTSFRLTACEDNVFLFENPEHDFPKSIRYEFLSAQKVKVRVGEGQNNQFELIYERIVE